MWELIEAKQTECIMDDSGIYTVINRVEKHGTHKDYAGTIVSVRVDIFLDDDTPLMSFVGRAENVRKAVTNWLAVKFYPITLGHASYIGAECERAAAINDYPIYSQR